MDGPRGMEMLKFTKVRGSGVHRGWQCHAKLVFVVVCHPVPGDVSCYGIICDP